MVKAGVASALLVGVGLLGIFMMDPKLEGKTIDQTFADPQVAKLAKAACAGKTAKINDLIAEGVKVNSQGKDGMVAMFYALKCEQPAALEALLKAGANPNHAGGKYGITGTYAAASYTDPIYLKLMLKHGGDPNLPLADGDTIFLKAFTTGQYSGKWDHFQLLLDYGVDINLPRSKGGGDCRLCGSIWVSQQGGSIVRKRL